MGIRRAAAAALLTVAFGGCAAAPPLPASAERGRWEEGEVLTGAGVPVLVRRGDSRAVLAVVALPVLGGLEGGRILRVGDRVRYHVVGSDRGGLIADRVELAPALTTSPERLVRPADLGDDPAAGGRVPVDVRPAADFAGAHLAGAISLPADRGWDVGRRLAIPPTTPLLFYAGSEFDPEPFEAAGAALADGFTDVLVLQGGMRAWIENGRPTAVSAAELLRRGTGGVAMLDLRPREEVEAGTIPGAVSIPAAELRPEPISGRPYWPALVLVGRDGQDPAVAEAFAAIRKWRSLDANERTQPIQILEGGFAGWIAAGGARGGAESLAGPERLGRFGDPERVEPAEFRAAWAAAGGGKLLLDVRPALRPGSVPAFAVNIPIEELGTRLDELPRDREIWVYCTSGQRATVAREILTRNGYTARYLKDYAPRP